MLLTQEIHMKFLKQLIMVLSFMDSSFKELLGKLAEEENKVT
jgi:hypothetical protein